jgi:thioesterase domain-containing protein
LLGYSFGTLLALELALELEAEGWEGQLYLVDGAPHFTKSLLQHVMGTNEEQFETNVICTIYNLIAAHEATSEADKEVFHIRNIFSNLFHLNSDTVSQIHVMALSCKEGWCSRNIH